MSEEISLKRHKLNAWMWKVNKMGVEALGGRVGYIIKTYLPGLKV